MARTTAPDGAAWSIDAQPAPNGIGLAITFPLADEPMTLLLALDHGEARSLARGILAAAGDATERSAAALPPPPGSAA